MAKRSLESKIKSKVKRKIKKARKNKTFNLIYIVIIIVLAIGIYYYLNNQPTPTYNFSTEQNEQGYYYYQLEEASSYYYDANNLVGDALKSELNEIITTGFVAQNYDAAKTVLAASDLNPNNPNKMWGIYLGNEIEPLWDAGATWDREHVWPNSRLGIPRVNASTKNQGTDLHNLRAVNGSINSTRSDNYFVDGSGEAGLVSDGFYPGDDHKGDVARILFYMVTMYEFLELADSGFDDGETYTMDRITMGKLSLLLDWHKQDPVDQFEKNRNQVIFEAQGNRNPYIDKPEFVHLIWESMTINELTKPVETGFRPYLRIQFAFNLYH